MSRAIVYVLTSVSLVYLTNSFGHYGLWFIMIPISLMFIFGLNHFENLEKEARHDNPETAFRRQSV
jgi:4-hydroxybenzoate polyprenyltransferase